jgi:hypothetical protein
MEDVHDLTPYNPKPLSGKSLTVFPIFLAHLIVFLLLPSECCVVSTLALKVMVELLLLVLMF